MASSPPSIRHSEYGGQQPHVERRVALQHSPSMSDKSADIISRRA